MDDKMFIDYLMQQNLQLQQNQNAMMQMLASMMVQPQPNPMAQMRAPQAPSPQQTMMQSNAAVTPNLTQVQDLQAEIAALKQQLMDAQTQLTNMQGQLASANERASAAEAKASASAANAGSNSDLFAKVSKLEEVAGKSIEDITKEISEGKKIVPKKGKGAQQAFKEMIDQGRASRDELRVLDSEDVLEMIEEDSNTDKSFEELISEKINEGQKAINRGDTNDFGF